MISVESRSKARLSLLRSAAVVLALVVGYAFLPLRGQRWWIGALVGVVAIVGIVPLTVQRLHAIRRSAEPGLVAIEAIVLLVAMLVLGFSAVYFAIDADQGQFTGLVTRIDAVYFTVVTLATIGFGDVSAVGQAARLLVVIQVAVNVFVVGVVIRAITRAAGALH